MTFGLNERESTAQAFVQCDSKVENIRATVDKLVSVYLLWTHEKQGAKRLFQARHVRELLREAVMQRQTGRRCTTGRGGLHYCRHCATEVNDLESQERRRRQNFDANIGGLDVEMAEAVDELGDLDRQSSNCLPAGVAQRRRFARGGP